MFPFPSRLLDVPGARLHYVDEGTGPTLLFLPAAPLWSFMYRNVIRGLCGRFRCVAIDFPGFGPSRAADARATEVDLDALSASVTAFVETLNLRQVILIGHDSGGLIGLHAAGRMAARVAGLVLVDTIGCSLGRFSPIRGMLRVVSSPLFAWAQARFNLLARLIATAGVRRRRLTVEERRAFLLACPTREARLAPLAVFRQMARRRDFLRAAEAGLADLQDLPVLSIFGQWDPVRLLGMQRGIAALFPRHRGVTVRGEAHFVPLGAPEEMVAAIEDWWQDESGLRPSPESHG